MSDTFLPNSYSKNENLNETGSRYFKFEKGENKFRVLASAIVGWEWWEVLENGKKTPKRVRIDEKINIEKLEEPESLKRFWAMPVYNYKLGRIQILEITQKGIQATLKGLAESSDWGSPVNYDIAIIKEGDGLDTTYETIPSPPKALPKEIKEEYEKTYINLEKLYEGGDPFTDEGDNFNVPDSV